jgi:hypothetical protein
MTPDQLSDDDKLLIRGMNHRGAICEDTAGRYRPLKSNVAALHFDGQMLVNMVWLLRPEVSRTESERA